jgi:hypothetical protein
VVDFYYRLYYSINSLTFGRRNMKKLVLLLVLLCLPAYADEGGGTATFSHYLKSGQKTEPARKSTPTARQNLRSAAFRMMRRGR